MKTDAEHWEELKGLLTKRIADPVAYVVTVKGKPLKHEFGKLVRLMQEGDEIWEWEWRGPVEPRNRYSLGWCVVRAGEVIASHCHSFS